ncbi:hypothetical protein [Pantoea vagans]|uniref:hypothetical protein n=1 Tax=Pantoea vagans TaxID=470934 RepID=UPI0023AF8ED0|nr:hypothetical protein [Pantoea vagans]MDE8556106.1 hypothetical protein [Pantoea vagans]MDE8576157.1 hypothetical protein [Pantoea vagans]
MSYEIDLKSADIAALVNSDESLKKAVIALYLKDNLPTLKITDLQGKAQAEQSTATDSLKLSADTLNVGIGTQATIDVTATGKGDVGVKSGDERIATAAYAGGKLTVNGNVAGDATIVLTKGDQQAELKVVVR